MTVDRDHDSKRSNIPRYHLSVFIPQYDNITLATILHLRIAIARSLRGRNTRHRSITMADVRSSTCRRDIRTLWTLFFCLIHARGHFSTLVYVFHAGRYLI